MEYRIYGPGETAADAEKIRAVSTTAAIRAWCEARQRRDPQFASFIDGREVVVSDSPPPYPSGRFVISVVVADPVFESRIVPEEAGK
jgi:hypothetical protein